MQEAHVSSQRALETAYDTFIDYAERFVLTLARQRAESFASEESSRSTTTTAVASRFHDFKKKLLDRLREMAQRFLRIVSTTMRRYRLAIICLCIYTIERASLERSSCLLAESFYGGHRVRLNPAKSGKARSTSPLDSQDKVRLAGLVALTVFVKGKLEQFYLHWKRNEQFLSDEKKLFVLLYPWIQSSFQSVSFLCKWNYLLGNSPYFDIPSLVLQQWLRRVSREDSTPTVPNASPPTSGSTSQPTSQGSDKSRLIQTASTATTLCLLVSWITWCRSKWVQLGREQDKDDILPPPPPPPTTLLAAKAGRCVLCGKRPPEKPTACTVSGFVGCGVCMEDYLQRNSQCPVTKRACTPESWVRLYEPHS